MLGILFGNNDSTSGGSKATVLPTEHDMTLDYSNINDKSGRFNSGEVQEKGSAHLTDGVVIDPVVEEYIDSQSWKKATAKR